MAVTGVYSVSHCYGLTESQRTFLEEIQKLDRQYVFDSGYFKNIGNILDLGRYSIENQAKLNEIRRAYIIYRRTGKVPILYQPDLPF